MVYNVSSGETTNYMENEKIIKLLERILKKVPLCIEDDSTDKSMKDYVDGWNFVSRAIRNTITKEIQKL